MDLYLTDEQIKSLQTQDITGQILWHNPNYSEYIGEYHNLRLFRIVT